MKGSYLRLALPLVLGWAIGCNERKVDSIVVQGSDDGKAAEKAPEAVITAEAGGDAVAVADPVAEGDAFVAASLTPSSWMQCAPVAATTSQRVYLVFDENNVLRVFQIPFPNATCDAAGNTPTVQSGSYQVTSNPQGKGLVWDALLDDKNVFGHLFTQIKLADDGKLFTAAPSATASGKSRADRASEFGSLGYAPLKLKRAKTACPATLPPSPSAGGDPVDFIYFNSGTKSLKLIWIDSTGKEVSYGSIAGNGMTAIKSFSKHNWVIRDDAGACLDSFTAASGIFML